MKKAFIITAHITGAWPVIKEQLLFSLVKTLKSKYPQDLIVVSCASVVPIKIQDIADLTVIDKATENIPYGTGEIALIRKALAVLENHNIAQVCKIGYDFIIDETNHACIDDWLNKQANFVSCYWNGDANTMGTWIWCGSFDFVKELFNSLNLTNLIIEVEIYKHISNMNKLDQVYLYKNNDVMLNNTWDTHGDLIIDGGKTVRLSSHLVNLLK